MVDFRLTWWTFWNLRIVYFFLILRARGVIDPAAENAGLSKPINSRLARKEINRNGPTMFAINMDYQLKLEIPSTIDGSDIIQSIFILIVTTVTIFLFQWSYRHDCHLCVLIFLSTILNENYFKERNRLQITYAVLCFNLQYFFPRKVRAVVNRKILFLAKVRNFSTAKGFS